MSVLVRTIDTYRPGEIDLVDIGSVEIDPAEIDPVEGVLS
jgi:hypothetical protein